MVACVNRAGVEVVDTVLEQLAASEAVLTPDEKELGVALVDIGGGTTDFAIFERGSLWHTGVAGGRRRPFHQRHRGRAAHADSGRGEGQAASGCALSAMVDEDETMEVASVGGRKPRVMARRMLSEILQPRAEEIFHLLWDEIRRAGYEKSLNSGIVLTGGGAMLEGMPEIAEQIFDLPVRRARRRASAGWPTTSTARRSRRRSGWCCTRTGTMRATGHGPSEPARSAAWPAGCGRCSRNSSDDRVTDGHGCRSRIGIGLHARTADTGQDG